MQSAEEWKSPFIKGSPAAEASMGQMEGDGGTTS